MIENRHSNKNFYKNIHSITVHTNPKVGQQAVLHRSTLQGMTAVTTGVKLENTMLSSEARYEDNARFCYTE